MKVTTLNAQVLILNLQSAHGKSLPLCRGAAFSHAATKTSQNGTLTASCTKTGAGIAQLLKYEPNQIQVVPLWLR
jgi:hypothetical protein